jgi:hypothetical protein
MFSRLWKGMERRRFSRQPATLEVEFEIEIYGFENEARPFFASGKTVNISRSGVLARLDVPILRGAVCKLFFRGTDEQVRPHHVAGRVARLSEDGSDFLIAVEFDEPLTRLEIAPATTVEAAHAAPAEVAAGTR